MVRPIGLFFVLLVVMSGFSYRTLAQVTSIGRSGITATIVEPTSIATGTVNTDDSEIAIMVIIRAVENGASATATYYRTNTMAYRYTRPTPSSPLITRIGANTLQVASFINDSALSPESNLIAGVYVSVTPSNITVNYN